MLEGRRVYDDKRSFLCVRSIECFGLTGWDEVRFCVMEEYGGTYNHAHISSEI